MEKRESHSFYDEENGVIFGSLSKGEDLMEGIIKEFEKYNFKSGAVTCMGSVSVANYVFPALDADGNPIYSNPVKLEGSIEVLNGTGFLSINEEGKTEGHFHAIFVNDKGQLFGGHLLPGQNPTLVTIEFIIQIGKSIQAFREFAPDLGFKVINFKKV